MRIEDSPLLYFNLYNPASVPKHVLLEEFVARQDILDEILEIIAANKSGEPQQHVLLIGPRGMGKTTMLFVVKYKVEDDPQLGREWLPLILSEENYGIGDLADFWLEAIRCLEGNLDLWTDKAEKLLKQGGTDLAERAREEFFRILASTGKRALFLLDNLNEIFNSITDKQELHVLRAFLMEDSRVMIIGASASYFSKVYNVDQPFFDFFRIFILERFNREEMDHVLRIMAERRKDATVLEILEKEPGRVQSLRILTGGNPRLVKYVYRLLHEGAFGSARHDLERLLDDCTPYFKHRIETLTTQLRRVFDAIARRWDPVGVGDLTVVLRKPSNHISAQIKRLVREGFAEETGGSDKKKLYQVAERFYNVFYLMRYSRTGRQRLEWMAGFMRVFYTLEDYQKWADKTEEELCGLKDSRQKEERLAFMSVMASAAEDAVLKEDLLNRTVRATINEAGYGALKRILGKELAKELGATYSIFEFLAGLPEEKQKEIGYQSENGIWWYRLGRILNEEKLYDLAGDAYRKSTALDPENFYVWNDFGTLLSDQNRNNEAEEAYLKAIELNQNHFVLWYNLANLLKRQKRYEEAEEAYHKAIEFGPESYFFSWSNLGSILHEQKRYKEAEEVFRKCIELDPEQVPSWNNLGFLLSEQERYQEAEEVFRKCIELDPKAAYCWNNLGYLLSEQKRYKEAEEVYHKAIELDPKAGTPHSGLAKVFLETGDNHDEALEESIQGLIQKPDHDFAHDIFKEACPPDTPAPWLRVLTSVLAYLKKHPQNEKVYEFALDGLIRLVAFGQEEAMRNLVEENQVQEAFEPLLLAVRARTDEKILETLAPERRTLVKDVMEKLV